MKKLLFYLISMVFIIGGEYLLTLNDISIVWFILFIICYILAIIEQFEE